MDKPRVIKARRKEDEVTDEVQVMRNKVERYATLQTLLGQKQEVFKKDTAGYETEMTQIEADVLKFAKHNQVVVVDGIKFEAQIKSKTTSYIPPEALHKMLIKQKKKDVFFDIIKVQLTAAKKVLGEVMLKGIMKSDTDMYNKINVVRKP